MQLCKAIDAMACEQLRVAFGDSFSRVTLPFDTSSQLQSNGEIEGLCVIVVRESQDWQTFCSELFF